MNYLFKTFALCHETTDNSSTDGFLFSMNQLKVPSVLFDCLLIQDILLLICQTKSNLENNPKSFKYLLSSGIPHLWQKKKKNWRQRSKMHNVGLYSDSSAPIVLSGYFLSLCCHAVLLLWSVAAALWLYQYAAHMGHLPAQTWKEWGL